MSEAETETNKVVKSKDISAFLNSEEERDFNEHSKALYNAFNTLILKASSLEELKCFKDLFEQLKKNFKNNDYANIKDSLRKKIYECL